MRELNCRPLPPLIDRSVIIRTFFRLIFGTIIFSLLVGLMLMPVVMSLVGPPPVSSVISDRPSAADLREEDSEVDVHADMVMEHGKVDMEMQSKGKAVP